ncbi:MAG: aminotransferase class IV [Polyangiaceae bacterium]
MTGRAVWIDGTKYAPESARISVYDRGLLYGDSVFEALRTYGGQPFALGEHLARLRHSAERVFISTPLGDSEWASEVDRAVAETGNEESYVRILLTRGVGPLSIDPDSAIRPTRIVFVEPLTVPAREAYVNGISVITATVRRTVDDTAAAGAKVANYLESILALREAKARGAAEALVVDSRGFVVEGTTSNVFAVLGGRLVTPPVQAGILPGITRAHILRAATALGLPVVERTLLRDELFAADEVFITSSIRELFPVVRVDGRSIAGGLPGPTGRALHRRFRESVGLGNRPMPFDTPDSSPP